MSTIINSQFSGHCILVTGGTTPAGEACATLLAAQGALVLLSGEDGPLMDSTLQSIRRQVPGCSVIGAVADLTTDDGLISFFLHARIAFPKVDAVVINPSPGWAPRGDQAVYRACMHKARNLMRHRKTGHIIPILPGDELSAGLAGADAEGIRLSVVKAAASGEIAQAVCQALQTAAAPA